MSELETLKAITTFSFFSDYIEYGINEFGAFCVMTFGPVVTGSRLSEYKVLV